MTKTIIDWSMLDYFTLEVDLAARTIPTEDKLQCARDLYYMMTSEGIATGRQTFNEWIRRIGGKGNIAGYARTIRSNDYTKGSLSIFPAQ